MCLLPDITYILLKRVFNPTPSDKILLDSRTIVYHDVQGKAKPADVNSVAGDSLMKKNSSQVNGPSANDETQRGILSG